MKGNMSAPGLRGWSSTNNLSDLKYFFELHVCFYFNCDLYTKAVMDEKLRTHAVLSTSVVSTAIADEGGRTGTGMADDEIEFWLRIFWFS
jgi:hypothetical protein